LGHKRTEETTRAPVDFDLSWAFRDGVATEGVVAGAFVAARRACSFFRKDDGPVHAAITHTTPVTKISKFFKTAAVNSPGASLYEV